MSRRSDQDTALDYARQIKPGQRSYFFTGYNLDVDTAWEDICPQGGDYPWPIGTATKVAISSSDAADTAAGAGCWSVEVHGLSLLGADQDEVIATNGTAEVESALDYSRVNRCHAQECGTAGGSNQGKITCRITSGGAKSGDILAEMQGFEGAAGDNPQYGAGEAGLAHYTVPKDKVMYITGGKFSVNTTGVKTADLILYEREGILRTAAPFLPRRIIDQWIEVQGHETFNFDSPIKIKELTDLWVRGKAAQSGTKISYKVDFYIIDSNAAGE